MAAELDPAFAGVEVTLIPSGGGVFEVTVDGRLVFSKRSIGRHAKPGEVVGLIRADRTEV